MTRVAGIALPRAPNHFIIGGELSGQEPLHLSQHIEPSTARKRQLPIFGIPAERPPIPFISRRFPFAPRPAPAFDRRGAAAKSGFDGIDASARLM